MVARREYDDLRRISTHEVTPADAKAAAIVLARDRYPIFGGDRLDVDATKTEERDLGWLLRVQSMRFLETGDASAQIMDAQPIFVHRRTGAATWVKRYGPTDFVVDGEPAPDWPLRATIVIPIAVIVQAASWTAMWWGWWVLARAIESVPLHLITLLLAIALPVLPTIRVIQYARFRSLSHWVSLAVVISGILLGELVSSSLGLAPGIDLEIERLGVSIDVPMELVKVVAVFGIGSIGWSAGMKHKLVRTAWDASRVISTPTDDDDDDDDGDPAEDPRAAHAPPTSPR